VDARAVVVKPSGQVDAKALPAFAESSSTAHSVVDPIFRLPPGAIGLEIEDRRHVLEFVGGPEHDNGTILATGPGVELAIDHSAYWKAYNGRLYLLKSDATFPGHPAPIRVARPIIEIRNTKAEVMAVHDEESGSRISRDQGMGYLGNALHLLSAVDVPEINRPIYLREILGNLPGWEVMPEAHYAVIRPMSEIGGMNHAYYTQFTVGTTMVGLRATQDYARSGNRLRVIEDYIDAGRSYGQQLTAKFVGEQFHVPDIKPEHVPFLSVIPDIDEFWGHSWLTFNHVGASQISAVIDRDPADPGLAKNKVTAASRNDFDQYLPAMRGHIRAYLDSHHDQIQSDFAQSLLSILRHYQEKRNNYIHEFNLDSIMNNKYQPENEEGASISDYLTSILRGAMPAGVSGTLEEAIGMFGEFSELDTAGSQLGVSLALLEIRHHGTPTSNHMTLQDMRQTVEELAHLEREQYQRALEPQLSEDQLMASIMQIRDNPVIQRFAPFFHLLATTPMPRPGQNAQPLAAAYQVQHLATALGAYATGGPPPHQGLRGQLEELIGRATEALSALPLAYIYQDESLMQFAQSVGLAQEALGWLPMTAGPA
jgi:hypothetical protein